LLKIQLPPQEICHERNDC